MKNKTLSGLLLTGALALSSVPAVAGILTYTDQTSFNNNTTSLTLTHVDLSNAAGFFGSSYTSGVASLTGNPLIFGSGTTSSLYNNEYYVYGSGLTSINFLASANVYAVSFYYGCAGGSCGGQQPRTVTATSTTGSITPIADATYSWPGGQTFYYSFVSTSPLTQISISGNTVSFQPNIGIGNITVGTGTATPEVSTFLMIGGGLAIIARYRRMATA